MSDLISRQDAIEELEHIMCDHPLQGYEDEQLLINAVKSLPSAEPTGDLISRKAAIEYLVTNMNWYNEDEGVAEWEEKVEAITDLVNGIPSADLQPLYMEHYRQGREDGRAEAEGGLMQAFSPD